MGLEGGSAAQSFASSGLTAAGKEGESRECRLQEGAVAQRACFTSCGHRVSNLVALRSPG